MTTTEETHSLPFHSRRSPVYSTKGICASSQPLASAAGAKILSRGGNAADAAVAIAAALNVTEPCSTGIGGDCFVLFYSNKTKKVQALLGNGSAPEQLTLERVAEAGFGPENPLLPSSVHTIPVPGAAAGWVDTIETFGSGNLTLREILEPAISLARVSSWMSVACVSMWNMFWLGWFSSISYCFVSLEQLHRVVKVCIWRKSCIST
jgi:gamma-glutamyltranspeptidase/glutathione hydrolase